jgi:hypothetical protein
VDSPTPDVPHIQLMKAGHHMRLELVRRWKEVVDMMCDVAKSSGVVDSVVELEEESVVVEEEVDTVAEPEEWVAKEEEDMTLRLVGSVVAEEVGSNRLCYVESESAEAMRAEVHIAAELL